MSKTYLQQTESLIIYNLVIVFIPPWLRFLQCLRRYKDTKLNAHLMNAAKYFASLSVQAVGVPYFYYGKTYDSAYYSFIAVSIVSTLFSYGWDLYMDWGLLRSEKGKKAKWGLRPKIIFPAWFYYFAVVTNLLMRFMWIINLFNGRYDLGYT